MKEKWYEYKVQQTRKWQKKNSTSKEKKQLDKNGGVQKER